MESKAPGAAQRRTSRSRSRYQRWHRYRGTTWETSAASRTGASRWRTWRRRRL